VQAARPVREAARGNGTDRNPVTAPRADLTSPRRSWTTWTLSAAGHLWPPRAARLPALSDPEHPARRGGALDRPAARPARGRVRCREDHLEVEVAWRCAQQVRSVYHQDSHVAGRSIAEKVLASFTTCPIPEVARLGRTLKQWRREFLGYFDTDGANNGGTEAIIGLIELHRRIARGFRNRENYRLRMLLIGGGLLDSSHTHP